MTISRKLYTSFSLILAIITFIIGVFFYTIINLNNFHILQNARYEQLRRVEKIKELNTAFAWVVLDIIVDRERKDIVKDRIKIYNKLFKQLWQIKKDVLEKVETQREKENLSLIFLELKKMEPLIKNDLLKMINEHKSQKEFREFNNIFDKSSSFVLKNLENEIEFLQERLNKTENEKDEFINKIKVELLVLLFIAFSLSSIISKKLIEDIKDMLSKLNKGVLQLLSNDENTIKINIEKGNELSEITNNINKYLEQKDAIIKSREELLRNISHELKTPITKGKFLLEKLKSQKEDTTIDGIDDVFYDIEELVSKLLQREKLNFATLNKSKFKVTTLILESLSKLSIDDENKINIQVDEEFEINGDFYYLNIAIKNLIDNAMKYTQSYPINIIIKNNSIEIQNEAKKLINPFTYYIQPFTREQNQQLGHGLGLNIANKILLLHQFKLNYFYKKPFNCFHIIFDS